MRIIEELVAVADNDGNSYERRTRGFAALERQPDFFRNAAIKGATTKRGRFARLSAALFGMTEFMQKPCAAGK